LWTTTLSIVLNAVGQDAPPPTGDLRAVLEDFVQAGESGRKLLSIGMPVNAATCRIYDRRSGSWKVKHDRGLAVHVRYRTGNEYGGVVHSTIVFLDGDKILDTFSTGVVRSTDARLLK
jgi:hypothetical protein